MNNKFYTSRLLKRVDSYNYNGIDKCMLYTEINTNVNIGDMVYINNGLLDNEKIIEKRKTDRHSKYVNGFKVLHVDGCKVVIDYNYIPFSYNTDSIEKYLQVYNVNNINEMLYYNSIYIDTYEIRYKKFQFGYTNNFLFIQNDLLIKDIIDNTDISFSKFINNILVTADNTNFEEFGESFYVYNGNNNYINVNAYFDNNDFSTYFSYDYNQLEQSIGYVNNGKFMFNSDIIYMGVTYKKDNPYKFVTTSTGINTWVIDTDYKQPILSKVNFKKGVFKGSHNDGLFGTYENQIEWNSNNIWNSGYIVNALWDGGELKSKSLESEQSFYMTENNGELSDSTDFTNNKGFGYNFIDDSTIISGTIDNGNFKNCIINGGIVEDVVKANFSSAPITSNINFKNGRIISSNISNMKMNTGEVNNSNVFNSILNKTNMINSEFDKCVATGNYNSSNSIKVTKSKLFTYSKTTLQTTNNSDLSAILRIFISESDYKKLSFGKSFTISKLNKEYIASTTDVENNILLPIETKYILDKYYNNFIHQNDEEIICSLKSNIDNRYNREIRIIGGTGDINDPYLYEQSNSLNTTQEYSIDIELGVEYAHYIIEDDAKYYYINGSTSYRISDSTTLESLFNDSLLENGSFNRGIISNTIIEHGDFINLNNQIKYTQIGTNLGGHPVYSPVLICNISGNNLLINIHNLNKNINENIEIGDTIWIGELLYILTSETYDFSGRYVIDNIDMTNNTISVIPQEQEIIDNIILINQNGEIGEFKYKSNSMPAFMGIHSRMHLNNTFKNGLLYGEYISGGLVDNTEFNNSDYLLTYSNIKLLRIAKSAILNTVVNAGLFYKSYISSATWNSGILYKSIWDNTTPFNNGCVVDSIWYNGIFNDGHFYNNSQQLSAYTTGNRFNPGLQHVSVSLSDIKYNWNNGVFNNGKFEKSFFGSGTFNGGTYIESHSWSGTFNGGIIGDKSMSYTKTSIGAVLTIGSLEETSPNINIINGAIVENALIGGDGAVIWKNGVFNGGVLTSFAGALYGNGGNFQPEYNEFLYISQYRYRTNWLNGTFNGGKVTGGVVWFDGTFNNGTFEPKPTTKYDINNTENVYADNINNLPESKIVFNWLGGTFNGGTFGTLEHIDNDYITPSWYGGTFNGGTFNGRVWRDGVVTAGKFNGSRVLEFLKGSNSVHTTTRDTDIGIYWINGIISDSNYEVINNDKVYIKQKLKSDTSIYDNSVMLNNIVWMDGVVNHKTSILNNCVWLNGSFRNGKMTNSIFNPKLSNNPNNLIPGNTTQSVYNYLNTCVWDGGILENSIFNYSIWKNGEFNNSVLNGAIWENGVFHYGTANNILWKDGIWKNGVWNGSSYNKLNNTTGPSSVYSDSNVFIANINANGTTFKSTNNENLIHINNVLESTYQYRNAMTRDRYVTIDIITNNRGLSYRNFPSLVNDGQDEINWKHTGIPLANTSPNVSNGESFAFKLIDFHSGDKSKMLNIGDKNGYEILKHNDYEYFLFFKIRYDIVSKTMSNTLNLGTSLNNTIPLGGQIRFYLDIEPLIDGKKNTTVSLLHSDDNLYYDDKGRPFVYVTGTTKSFRIPITINNIEEISKTINFSAIFFDNPLSPSMVTGNPGEYTSVITLTQSTSELNTNEPYVTTLQIKYQNTSNKLWKEISSSIPRLDTLGNDYTYTYGNGQFLKGVWENGVWNTGYRNDEANVIVFNRMEYHSKFDDYNHFIYFNTKSKESENLLELNVGDKVSIGNIIGIDINGKRVLLNGIYNISSKSILNDGSTQFSIKIICNDIVKSITKDSDDHHIKISNNIWLNGNIKTGRLINTIFNNVHVNGDNFNLVLDYVNIINGNIKGCTINTTRAESKFTNNFYKIVKPKIDLSREIITDFTTVNLTTTQLNDSGFGNIITQANKNYTRSLIQNGIISDYHTIDLSVDITNMTNNKNVKYRTILNLHYPSTSEINNGITEGSFTNLYTGSDVNKTYTNRGRSTVDVLSSVSNIYNPLNKSIDEHYLGSKYNIIDNYIPNGGNFITSCYNKHPQTPNSQYSEFIENYELDGWETFTTFKWIGNAFDFEIGMNTTGIGNIITPSNDRMAIQASMLTLTNKNTYNKFISKRSYTMLDVTLGSDYRLNGLTITDDKPNGVNPDTVDDVQYLKYGIVLSNLNPIYDKVIHTLEPTCVILGNTRNIKEYYYDASRMDIKLEFPSSVELTFDNISYYEVDMIPFFKYFTNDNVNYYYKVPKYETVSNILASSFTTNGINSILIT